MTIRGWLAVLVGVGVVAAGCTRTIVVQAPTTTTVATTTTTAPPATTTTRAPTTTTTRPATTSPPATVRLVATTSTTVMSEKEWYQRYGQLAVQASTEVRLVADAKFRYGTTNVKSGDACQQLLSAVQEARDVPPPPKPEARQVLAALLDSIASTCSTTGMPITGATIPGPSLGDYAAAASS